jgi:mono/diheme cytochrome c family protein
MIGAASRILCEIRRLKENADMTVSNKTRSANPRSGSVSQISRWLAAFAGSGVLIVAGMAWPARADADNGERLAQRWCASCHVVGSQQTRAASDAPPFSAIAARENYSGALIALYLLNPHPRMPDMNLTRAEAADLAAYIATQKR